eukprot:tig00000769_g4031.t1
MAEGKRGTSHACEPYVYDAEWDVVCAAFFRRFPTNPKMPYMLKTETESESIDEATGIERQVKIIHVDVLAPSWVRRLVGLETFVFKMEIEIDRAKQCMRTVCTNVTWPTVMQIEEVAVVRAVEGEATRTVHSQSAVLDIVALPSLAAGYVEKYAINAYVEKSREARGVDEQFIADELRERAAAA